MKQKVHTLSNDKNFKLIGIASHLSPYKLSWSLNKELDARFQQSENLILSDKSSTKPLIFSTYKFEDGNDSLYTLYSNRSEDAVLLKSIRNIDYVLKYEGIISDQLFKLYIEKLKKIRNILTAFEIDNEQIKPKEWEYFS